MKKLFVGWVSTLALTISTATHAFTVFACEPEWAALVRSLLPEAKLHVATHAGQDPHHIEARPGLIAQLRSADAVVCTGAELEVGWLPALQQKAGNPKANEPFYAADYVTLLEKRTGAIATPWSGDVHPAGNPHVHADPRRMRLIAGALADYLKQRQPGKAKEIEARAQQFDDRWDKAIPALQRRAAGLKGKSIVVHHTTFSYLWDWLGIQVVADLEPKPGMPPTPGHLRRVLEQVKAPAGRSEAAGKSGLSRAVDAIVTATYQDQRPGQWLEGQLNRTVPLVVLPATVAENASGEDLLKWYEGLITTLQTQIERPRAGQGQ